MLCTCCLDPITHSVSYKVIPPAGNSECGDLNNIVRAGMPFSRAFALEPLLKKFGVDVMWAGHQHSYERIWPIFNGTVLNRTKEAYNEPQGPVHIITGSPVRYNNKHLS